MKRISLLIILAFGILNFGCEKCDCEKDEYYVKYETYGHTIYGGQTLNVTISTETNENETFIVNAQGSWEIIIGPVQKGFNASLKVGTPMDNHLTLEVSISVSKNDSPFALKASDESDPNGNTVEISYKIDY